MNAGDLVVGDGDRAVATGRLVRDERGDWLEPPVMIAAPGRAGNQKRRIRPVSKSAVKVAGADFDTVAGRFEKDGMVEGRATVTGTWSAGQLRAERQALPAPRPPRHLFAAGLVATVPVIILFAFIERRVVSGLTAGAVK